MQNTQSFLDILWDSREKVQKYYWRIDEQNQPEAMIQYTIFNFTEEMNKQKV
jgi:hypothetical protein